MDLSTPALSAEDGMWKTKVKGRVLDIYYRGWEWKLEGKYEIVFSSKRLLINSLKPKILNLENWP